MVTRLTESSPYFSKSHFTVKKSDHPQITPITQIPCDKGANSTIQKINLRHRRNLRMAFLSFINIVSSSMRLVYTVTRMGIVRKIKRAVRGEVKPKTIVLEAWRRTLVSRQARHERNNLDRLNSEAPKLRLAKTDDLLTHFRSRTEPHFLAGFSTGSVATLQRDLFPLETEALLNTAQEILDAHSWNFLGFGLRSFGDEIQWRRDPLSDMFGRSITIETFS
jgi:hypothetical protein